MYTPSQGAVLTSAQLSRMGKSRRSTDVVEYSASNTKTITVPTSNPIARIKCRLTGTFTVATAAAVATSDLGLGIIRNLKLARDGDDVLFNVPGYALQQHDRQYSQVAPLATAPAVAIGSSDFDYQFTLFIDPGDYTSLLDASGRTLTLSVTWGTAADIAAAGGGGTVAVSDVQLEVNVIAVRGALPGERGGVGFPYLEHRVNYIDKTITAATTEYPIDLYQDKLYSGITLFSRATGVPVDTIFNRGTLVLDTNQLWTAKREFISDENRQRYRYTAALTGVYVLDFVDGEHPEDMIAVQGTQLLKLLNDVNLPAGTITLTALVDYYTLPARKAA